MIGRTLSHYEIVSSLGAGGMGEVYKAKDLKLGRTVAVKVLQKEIASDPERLKRFDQEARSASALNHPNIVTIYDIDEHESTPFIAMEYVEGRTLHELFGTRELTLNKALQFAIQIADGLARAHSQGIVHRDLKPDNVMVTEDGLVKILDFGLAKLMEPSDWTEASTRDLQQPHTKEGHIVGTVPYMAPEQAQGEKVDSRSDIFSFGSVLYEMVTGRRAFTAESVPELLTAIIRDEPKKVSDLVPSVPLDLDKLIARAMRKEPERRFQSMADVKVELQEIKEELDSGSFVSAEQVLKREIPHRRWLWAVAGLVAVGITVASWMYFPSSQPPPRTIPLTSYPGTEHQPAISPDGSQVAFTRAGEAGFRNLYVKLIDGGEPLLISHGTGDACDPAWSPDGHQIAFIRQVKEDDGSFARSVFVVSALGGAERKIATSRAGYKEPTLGVGLSWSPDGKLLAIADRESTEDPDSIFLLSFETGERRKLTAPPLGFTGDHQPRFSPDGRALAFVRTRVSSQSDIYLVPVEGGEPRRLTSGNRYTAGLDWTSDGRSIVFSATRSGRVGWFSLWRVSSAGGEPEPLEIGEQGVSPSLSRRGGRLSYAKTEMKWDILRVGGPLARVEDQSQARVISSSGGDWFPHYSPDGQKISFTSTRSGYAEVWICGSDGSNPRQLTFLEDPHTSDGNWSPDGQQIVFHSPKEGYYNIYVMNVSGGFPRQITTETTDESHPRWSNDGRWIYFASNRTGKSELFKMPADGGDAVQLTTNGGTVASESPDSRFIFFTKSQHLASGPHGIWRIPIDGGEEVQVHDHGEYILFDVLAQGICYMNRDAVPPTVEFLDFITGEVRQIAVLETQPSIWGLSVSPDGRTALYSSYEHESDIMLVENFR